MILGGLDSKWWVVDYTDTPFWWTKEIPCRFWIKRQLVAQDQCTTYYNSLKLAFAEGHCNSARCASEGGILGERCWFCGDPTAAGLPDPTKSSSRSSLRILKCSLRWLYDIFRDQETLDLLGKPQVRSKIPSQQVTCSACTWNLPGPACAQAAPWLMLADRFRLQVEWLKSRMILKSKRATFSNLRV